MPFFAGIGVWSSPCETQGGRTIDLFGPAPAPVSLSARPAKAKAGADDRHLWPAWHRLIRERRPPVVFGEQVEAAIGHGWLDAVSDDMEGIGYAVGAVGIPCCGRRRPHIEAGSGSWPTPGGELSVTLTTTSSTRTLRSGYGT